MRDLYIFTLHFSDHSFSHEKMSKTVLVNINMNSNSSGDSPTLSLFCFFNIALIPVKSTKLNSPESRTALSQLGWRSWHDQELTAFGHNITNEYLWFRIHSGFGSSVMKEGMERETVVGVTRGKITCFISAFQIFVCSFSLIYNLEAYCPVCIQSNHRQNIQVFP